MMQTKYFSKSIAILFSLLSFLFVFNATAQDGKSLFIQNCASCHAVNKKLTGPALAGVEERWPDKAKLHLWIRNNIAVLKSGDPYANKLFEEYGKTPMNLFPNLEDKEIDAILTYVKTEEAKANAPSTAAAGSTTGTDKGGGKDNTLLFGILSIVLAIVALILMQVNKSLKKLSDDKEGNPTLTPIPAWRNKTFITLGCILLFLVGGFYVVKGAIGLGRTQEYTPQQPIVFSHKVHAGTNQINCLYCHTGAQEGKHSNIPSTNVCLNCHMGISEYAGEKIYNAEGEEVNGTAEIQKLYKYAGYEPGKPWDDSKATPIPWVQVHNLPDHVYFNHSQHTMVGNVQCQTCHGDIPNMTEVKQFAPLSMGWCINCHRETQVNFKDNGFYSIYEKYHDELKSGKKSSITVNDIGGTECQKCHY